VYDDGKGVMLMGRLERDDESDRAPQTPSQKVATPRRVAWRYYALAVLLFLLGTAIVMLIFGPPPPLEIAGMAITAVLIAYIIQAK